ncbi:carboxymuconolactone decarboxylase family protein [Nocardioides sp. S-58]|uniref:Carboxymuconolactone decarboxylase family protein n=1 Tax=Nocardioides renjunii TaxID=3095075 RepID=A0ABU5KBR3_9ACTN|nr:carboxymuconolactone decarboxylase family protein [Nocardioides sp. S-58]MDZ5662413.1 carboxymuconolactone decarboxylase family protein [Nocardioides sp. S-58]
MTVTTTTPGTTNIADLEPHLYGAAIALGLEADAAAIDAGLSTGFVELLKMRVSQLNRCAFCLRWHSRDALAKGETADRLAVLSAWRETSYFDEAERAELALVEHVAIIAERTGEAPDTSAMTPEQVAAVAWVAIAIGTLNRIAVTSAYAVGPA